MPRVLHGICENKLDKILEEVAELRKELGEVEMKQDAVNNDLVCRINDLCNHVWRDKT